LQLSAHPRHAGPDTEVREAVVGAWPVAGRVRLGPESTIYYPKRVPAVKPPSIQSPFPLGPPFTSSLSFPSLRQLQFAPPDTKRMKHYPHGNPQPAPSSVSSRPLLPLAPPGSAKRQSAQRPANADDRQPLRSSLLERRNVSNWSWPSSNDTAISHVRPQATLSSFLPSKRLELRTRLMRRQCQLSWHAPLAAHRIDCQLNPPPARAPGPARRVIPPTASSLSAFVSVPLRSAVALSFCLGQRPTGHSLRIRLATQTSINGFRAIARILPAKRRGPTPPAAPGPSRGMSSGPFPRRPRRRRRPQQPSRRTLHLRMAGVIRPANGRLNNRPSPIPILRKCAPRVSSVPAVAGFFQRARSDHRPGSGPPSIWVHVPLAVGATCINGGGFAASTLLFHEAKAAIGKAALAPPTRRTTSFCHRHLPSLFNCPAACPRVLRLRHVPAGPAAAP